MRPTRFSSRRAALLILAGILGIAPVGLACSLFTDFGELNNAASSDGGVGESNALADAAGAEGSSGRDATLDGDASGTRDAGDAGQASGVCAPNANTLYCEDFDLNFAVTTPPMYIGGSCTLSSLHTTSAPNALRIAMNTGGSCSRAPVALPAGPTNLRATARLWFDEIQGRVHVLDFASSSGLQGRTLYINLRPTLVEAIAYTSLPDGGAGSYLGLASRAYTTPLGRWIEAEFRLEALNTTPMLSVHLDGVEVIGKTAAPNWANATNLQFIMGVFYADAPATVFVDDVRVERF